MKAAVHTSYGPPDVVRIADVDTPAPREDELLVRVDATTVNRTDCAYRAARPFFMRLGTGLVRPKRTILGNEFAGEIEAIGGDVTSFGVGDRVFGYVEGAFGAHAEYLTVPAHGSVASVPATVTLDVAAAGTEGSHYAMAFLRTARIRSGQDVLVHGATGAIGSAAVQLVKSIGAHVTAVCATEHLALVTELGADRVIDYTVEDFTRDAQTYDVVLDAVGKSSFGRCRRLLRPGGVYASSELGPFAQNLILPLVTRLFRGRRVVFPFPRHDQAMVHDLGERMASGDFTPVIDRHYPLDRIVEAYRYVETGQKVGNVIISVR